MREIRIDERDLTRGRQDQKHDLKQDSKTKHLRDVQVSSQDMGFRVNEIRDDNEKEYEEVIVDEREPGEQVRVKFDKFVQLVATHNFEEVLKNHADEDIIMNSNLLMDLASAHEDQEEDPKRQPMLIGVGVLIGLVAAYILLKLF